jgi:hypothetical protein
MDIRRRRWSLKHKNNGIQFLQLAFNLKAYPVSPQFFSKLILGVALCTGFLAAHATPITYTLSGVTFDDGTLATGSFIYDADTRQSLAFDITTTAGLLSSYNWSKANSGLYAGAGAGANNFALLSFTGQRLFNFSFLDPFTNAGGVNLINIASTYECANCNPYRRVTAGSVTSLQAGAIPEPGTLALMLPAFAAMAFAARRRKERAL